MRKRREFEGQASLFDAVPRRTPSPGPARPRAAAEPAARRWRMPEVSGHTVAEIRLRWPKRLSPAQAARVQSELSTLPKALTRLGYGTVIVERAFVRRRKS